MVRLLSSAVVLAIGIAMGVLLNEDRNSAEATGEVKCATKNGDANGDGMLNFLDVVYIATHIVYPTKPPPVPFCPEQCALPATGQTQCFDATGQTVPCSEASCPGQDGFYQAGCSSEDRFIDHGDGTVTDTCTGLMWLKDNADTNGDGTFDGTDWLSWCDGLAFCENLNFAGHDDWRLPSIGELQSLVDYGRFDPCIDPVFNAVLGNYWSSTTSAQSPGNAWDITFDRGRIAAGTKHDRDVIRAVRSTN